MVRHHHHETSEKVREASHTLSNETTKLRAAIATYTQEPDPLRALVKSMQDKKSEHKKQQEQG